MATRCTKGTGEEACLKISFVILVHFVAPHLSQVLPFILS